MLLYIPQGSCDHVIHFEAYSATDDFIVGEFVSRQKVRGIQPFFGGIKDVKDRTRSLALGGPKTQVKVYSMLINNEVSLYTEMIYDFYIVIKYVYGKKYS